MNPVTIAVAAGVAGVLLTALGMAVRRSRPVRIDTPETAAAAAERAIAGFVAASAVVGADGAGALAVSGNRVVVVAPAGRRIVAREVSWTAVRATAQGILIDTGDRRIGRVALSEVDVLDIRRLTSAGNAAR